MNESAAVLIPVTCPYCGRHAFSSAWCETRIETAAGTLAVSANYARFLCVCGGLSETKRSEQGRLYLVRFRRQGQNWGRRRR